MIDWSSCFEEQSPAPPASESDIRELLAALLPLTDSEIAEINAAHQKVIPHHDPHYGDANVFDARNWRIPQRQFPDSYQSFLRWSNGGGFVNAARTFANFFGTNDVREMMLAYEIPQYMPGAVPFAFDGGGTFYLFDMRSDPVNSEYPIVFSHAGNLSWDDAVYVSDDFYGACSGKTDPYDSE